MIDATLPIVTLHDTTIAWRACFELWGFATITTICSVETHKYSVYFNDFKEIWTRRDLPTLLTTYILVRKRDGLLLCRDYRELNKHIRWGAYPLLRVDTMLQSLQGKNSSRTSISAPVIGKYPCAMRRKQKVCSPCRRDCLNLQCFHSDWVLLRPSFCGWCVGCSKSGMIGKSVYIDDILIATEPEQRHLKVLSEVLQTLKETRLKLKPQKCTFLERHSLAQT